MHLDRRCITWSPFKVFYLELPLEVWFFSSHIWWEELSVNKKRFSFSCGLFNLRSIYLDPSQWLQQLVCQWIGRKGASCFCGMELHITATTPYSTSTITTCSNDNNNNNNNNSSIFQLADRCFCLFFFACTLSSSHRSRLAPWQLRQSRLGSPPGKQVAGEWGSEWPVFYIRSLPNVFYRYQCFGQSPCIHIHSLCIYMIIQNESTGIHH